jgi:hypothetical protein
LVLDARGQISIANTNGLDRPTPNGASQIICARPDHVWHAPRPGEAEHLVLGARTVIAGHHDQPQLAAL